MRITPFLAGIALVGIAFGASACTSDTATPKETTSATTTAYDWDVAYAGCMREAGIDFPDPEPGDAGGGQVPVADEQAYQAADKSCTANVSKSHGARPVSDADRDKRDHYNDEYADTIDCLRKKGYEVEVIDGGYIPEKGIPDADAQACSAGQSDQQVGE
jgi:hypothetical protein